jgi:TetR/AcrR family transcriptional regulator
VSIDSRQRILTEAERLFARRGFAGTSLSSIATAAGLGNAGLIHHYPSKAALYRAVLDTIAADLDARDAAALAAADDPVAQLRGLVDSLLSLHRDRPTALMIIAQEFLDRSGRIDTAGVLPLAGVVRDTMRVIEAGQRDRSARDGDPLAMTAALHGALLHGCLGRLVYQRTATDSINPRPEDAWEHEITRAALAGIVTTSPT